MSRILALFALVGLLAVCLPAQSSFAASSCDFVLGFKTLHDAIPTVAGDCVENEHHNPANGDGLQATTHGLLVWRKADNFTAFTDGYRSWVNGPYGVQERLNSERFPWEAQAPATSAPVAQSPSGCGYSGAFKTLHDVISWVVGTCVTGEQGDPSGQVTTQLTDKGVLAWFKSDGHAIFANGRNLYTASPRGDVSQQLGLNEHSWDSLPGGTILHSDTYDSAPGPNPTAEYWSGVANGEYVLRQKSRGGSFFIDRVTQGYYEDTTIQVDARLAEGSDSASFGILCRDPASPDGGISHGKGYALEVMPAQNAFVLLRSDGGSMVPLVPLQSSSAIHGGNQTNHLELRCVGSTISASINGQQVASVQDSTYRSGAIYYLAQPPVSGGEVDARFDNLVIQKG